MEFQGLQVPSSEPIQEIKAQKLTQRAEKSRELTVIEKVISQMPETFDANIELIKGESGKENDQKSVFDENTGKEEVISLGENHDLLLAQPQELDLIGWENQEEQPVEGKEAVKNPSLQYNFGHQLPYLDKTLQAMKVGTIIHHNLDKSYHIVLKNIYGKKIIVELETTKESLKFPEKDIKEKVGARFDLGESAFGIVVQDTVGNKLILTHHAINDIEKSMNDTTSFTLIDHYAEAVNKQKMIKKEKKKLREEPGKFQKISKSVGKVKDKVWGAVSHHASHAVAGSTAQSSSAFYSIDAIPLGIGADLTGFYDVLIGLGETKEAIEEFMKSTKAQKKMETALNHLWNTPSFKALTEDEKALATAHVEHSVYFQVHYHKSIKKLAGGVIGAASGGLAVMSSSAELAHAAITASCFLAAGSTSILSGSFAIGLATRNLYKCYTKKKHISELKTKLKEIEDGSESYKIMKQYRENQKMHLKYKAWGNTLTCIGGAGAIALGVSGIIIISTSPATMGVTVPLGVAAVGLAAVSLGSRIVLKEMEKREINKIQPQDLPVGVSMRLLHILDKENRDDNEKKLIEGVCNYLHLEPPDQARSAEALKKSLIIELSALKIAQPEVYDNIHNEVIKNRSKQT